MDAGRRDAGCRCASPVRRKRRGRRRGREAPVPEHVAHQRPEDVGGVRRPRRASASRNTWPASGRDHDVERVVRRIRSGATIGASRRTRSATRPAAARKRPTSTPRNAREVARASPTTHVAMQHRVETGSCPPPVDSRPCSTRRVASQSGRVPNVQARTGGSPGNSSRRGASQIVEPESGRAIRERAGVIIRTKDECPSEVRFGRPAPTTRTPAGRGGQRSVTGWRALGDDETSPGRTPARPPQPTSPPRGDAVFTSRGNGCLASRGRKPATLSRGRAGGGGRCERSTPVSGPCGPPLFREDGRGAVARLNALQPARELVGREGAGNEADESAAGRRRFRLAPVGSRVRGSRLAPAQSIGGGSWGRRAPRLKGAGRPEPATRVERDAVQETTSAQLDERRDAPRRRRER